MTLGSLFDGAGTFPFAASLFGIEPKWASEIELFPVEVTKKRFPQMIHLGDVTKINGAEIEPVDIITFGSPCQDLSVAGKRAGLDGERSGLFMEAVRIIKEMRRNTNGKYPRYAVWENVPGAFSSNKGEDFRTVLEELCKVKDGSAVIPRPSGEKWRTAGYILADEYSVAWRVLDAQFWGVPQRRRRIFLVADFGGGSAGEILFEQDGLQRSFAESRETWKGIAGDTAFGTCAAGKCFDARGNGNGNIAPTVTGDHNNRITDYTAVVCGVDTYNSAITGDKSKTILHSHMDCDGVPCVAFNSNIAGTLDASYYKGCVERNGTEREVVACQNGTKWSVRRLTPTECARLQGMPDWWCKDINHFDSAEYKMWGNGMALPCVMYIMQGIADMARKEDAQ